MDFKNKWWPGRLMFIGVVWEEGNWAAEQSLLPPTPALLLHQLQIFSYTTYTASYTESSASRSLLKLYLHTCPLRQYVTIHMRYITTHNEVPVDMYDHVSQARCKMNSEVPSGLAIWVFPPVFASSLAFSIACLVALYDSWITKDIE